MKRETRLASGLRTVESKGISFIIEMGMALIMDSFAGGFNPPESYLITNLKWITHGRLNSFRLTVTSRLSDQVRIGRLTGAEISVLEALKSKPAKSRCM